MNKIKILLQKNSKKDSYTAYIGMPDGRINFELLTIFDYPTEELLLMYCFGYLKARYSEKFKIEIIFEYKNGLILHCENNLKSVASLLWY